MRNDLSFLNFSDDEERRTVAHALDLAYRAIDSSVCSSAFLNVREQNLVKTALESDGSFWLSRFRKRHSSLLSGIYDLYSFYEFGFYFCRSK